MPPLLPLSHFIGTGYVKNLLAPTTSASVPGDANNFVTRLALENFICGSFASLREFENYARITQENCKI